MVLNVRSRVKSVLDDLVVVVEISARASVVYLQRVGLLAAKYS